MGIKIHRFHTYGSGKNVHISVVNRPAVCGNIGGSGLIARRKHGIVVVLTYHQLVHLKRNRQKCQQSQHRHYDQYSAVLSGICPKPHKPRCFPPICHRSPAFHTDRYYTMGSKGAPHCPLQLLSILYWPNRQLCKQPEQECPQRAGFLRLLSRFRNGYIKYLRLLGRNIALCQSNLPDFLRVKAAVISIR